MTAGRLVPDSFIEEAIMPYLGFGEVVDGRYYAHDLSSVPVGWARRGDKYVRDHIVVRTQSVYMTFSNELLADRGGRAETWAERAAREFERNRLRNRVRRIPSWWSDRVLAARYNLAHAIYPFRESED